METVYRKVCGIDVHKKTLTACIIVEADDGSIKKIIKSFSTMSSGLAELCRWLSKWQVTHVVMESTGVYWKPVYNHLEQDLPELKLILANARNVKNVPGRKTDIKDSEWLATLLRAGLVESSFVPPKDIRELRDLTKMRSNFTADRSAVKNRIQNILEDANLKIGSVVSDVFGKSGLAMVRMLAANSSATADELAGLAKGSLKKKVEELKRASESKFTEHHSYMLRLLIRQLDSIDENLAELERQISDRIRRYAKQMELLCQIPGVNHLCATVIIAQLGVDMSVFPSDRHVSSWAGVCPGNHESAGKRLSGKTTSGNKYLKAALTQVAWAAAHTKNTYLASKYWALRKRRGEKRAIIAIAHKILIQAYHLLHDMQEYRELGPDYLLKDSSRSISKMVRVLEAQGFVVKPREEADDKTA